MKIQMEHFCMKIQMEHFCHEHSNGTLAILAPKFKYLNYSNSIQFKLNIFVNFGAKIQIFLIILFWYENSNGTFLLIFKHCAIRETPSAHLGCF